MPALNIVEVVEKAGVSKPTASGYIGKLEEYGILTEYTKRERDRDWIARDILDVIEQDSPAQPS